jgi:hypothetical protein|tara:strand:- start:204 stop:395 length:192 start_codon:yes stop_codon:yes gene_type:complete
MFIKYLDMVNERRLLIEQRYKTHKARYKHLILYLVYLDRKEKKRVEKAYIREMDEINKEVWKK